MSNPLEAIKNYRSAGDSLGTSGQPSEDQIKLIADAGFEVVINLALHDDPRYSLPDETATVQSLGMAYIHIPVQFAQPTLENLAAFFQAMKAHSNHKVWVHCAANWRVTVFVGLYREIVLGWPHEKAFELLRATWAPNEVWVEFIGRALDHNNRLNT